MRIIYSLKLLTFVLFFYGGEASQGICKLYTGRNYIHDNVNCIQVEIIYMIVGSDIKSGFTIVGTSMGRKQWQGRLMELVDLVELLLLLLCTLVLHHAIVLADGDVGEYD